MKELDADEFRRLGHLAVELAAEHMFGMRERSVFTPMTAAERAVISNAELPAAGLAPQRVLDFVRDRIMTHPMGNGHPRFFGGSVPAPSSMGVIADLLAASMNPSGAVGDHAAIYVERCAVRWLMELIGFPVTGSRGVLVGGGSMAPLACLAAARAACVARAASVSGALTDRARPSARDVDASDSLGPQPPQPPQSTEPAQPAQPTQLAMYVSDQGHTNLLRAASLMGLGTTHVRIIPSDASYRMDVSALRDALARDREAGYQVLCVCANAGTLSTGAIDPLSAIAELCHSGGHWLHIDATIGGLAALDPTLLELKALGAADSVTLAPHKWLGVPAECGVALVRDGRLLELPSQPPAQRGDVVSVASGATGAPWQSEQSVQGHGFRALKLWATLLHLGRDGIRSRVEQHRALARSLAARIAEESRLELIAQPELSIVCFRYIGIAERSEDRLRAFNRALVAQLQAEGEVILTGTELKTGYALRASIMHHATRSSDVAAMLHTVLKTAARLNEAGFRASYPQLTPIPLR